MSLDLRVYRNITEGPWTLEQFRAIFNKPYPEDEQFAIVAWNPVSPEYLEPLEPQMVYRTPAEYPDFVGVGSYGWHANWMRHMESFINETSIPLDDYEMFKEFVSYDQVEGVFGATYCRCFAYVFTTYRDEALLWAGRKLASEQDVTDFVATYDRFMNAFSAAAENGAVKYC